MKGIFTLVTLVAATLTASAEPDRHDHERARGVIQHQQHGNRRTTIFERRAPAIIARDPQAHTYARDYHVRHNWATYHASRGGWFGVFGIRTWAPVHAVTCEAANAQTGELYPVTANRASVGWSDAAINGVLDQALDECAADAGANVCVAASPACTYTR
jgi:hypothetical protein